MWERSQSPVKFERNKGYQLVDRRNIARGGAPMVPEDEIEQLLDKIAEIRNFLFCRLLLAQMALLPVALQATSIEESLGKEDVTREHLRDLCFKLERPVLQDVRDACADFLRERDGLAESDITKDPAEEIEEHVGNKPESAERRL
jgi:hypothetical protein